MTSPRLPPGAFVSPREPHGGWIFTTIPRLAAAGRRPVWSHTRRPALPALSPRRLLPPFAYLGAGLLCLPALAQDAARESSGPTTWWMPTNVSTFGGEVDYIFYYILWLTGIIGVAVFVALFVFLFRYRYRPDRAAKFIHGNNKLETVWTLVPTVILAITAAVSQASWSKIKSPESMPQGPGVIELEVVAKQFQWLFHYPGRDGKLGHRDLRAVNISGDNAAQIGLLTKANVGDRKGMIADPDAEDDIVTRVLVVPV